MSAQPPKPSHPEKIGKYTIARELGKGAMGTVYEGFDPVIERRVAIKTILREVLEAVETEEAVARFKREAQAGGRLNHPGIVAVYEFGEDERGAFIVMEYVEGKELKQYFRSGSRFDLIDVFELMKQLLSALDHSHRQGVVHRDIKPANLMVLPGMKLKVMDFGIARIASSSLTQVGTVVGTPTHMSPEQLTGLPADGRADLWSTGVVLYELLTGRSPFLAETPAQVMHKVLLVHPDPPSSLQPSLPPAFDTVIARALGKKPEERFQSAREFHAALLQAFQGKAIMAPRGMTDAEHAMSESEATRVQPPPSTSATATFTLPPEAASEVERSLSRYIGPLAKVLMRQASATATNPDTFLKALAENIEDAAERTDFLAKFSRIGRSDASATQSGAGRPATLPGDARSATQSGPAKAKAGFTPENLAAAEKRLANYVGPLARVLIKEAAGKSGNLRELYAQLADHIDDEAERRAFLAELSR